jgi:hypothetical protein
LEVYFSVYITSSKEAAVPLAAQCPAGGQRAWHLPGSSPDGDAQLVEGGGERLLDLVPGGGHGEDEPQVLVPVRERADRLADRDRYGQAGDPGTAAALFRPSTARSTPARGTGSMYTPADPAGSARRPGPAGRGRWHRAPGTGR